MTGQPSMFSNLPVAMRPEKEEPPAVDLTGGIPIGTRRGNIEGLIQAAQGVEVWCGPRLGWRSYAKPLGTTDQLVVVYGVLTGGMSFELSGTWTPAPKSNNSPDSEEAEDQ